jgi:DNA modification methylase
MNVDVVLIDDLELDPNNARRHSKKNLDAIAASLERFGQRKPIVVWRNRVVAGNGTLVAARSLGWREISVARCPDDWSVDKVTAYALADNRSAELAVWDEQVLTEQLKQLELADWDVEALGFDATVEPLQDVVEDEIPEQVEPKSKLGDVWKLGKHRVMCGDSTNVDDVAKLMRGDVADLIHADPPYGMGKEKDGVENDNLYADKLDKFQMQWFQAFRPHVADNAGVYIWGNPEDLWRLWYVGGLKDFERITFRNEIVWSKPGGMGIGSEAHRSYAVTTERCLFLMLGEQGFNNNADNYWEGFEPIRNYLKTEREKLGWNNKIVADFFGFHPRMADHWFSQSQWSFPQKEQYERLQREAKYDGFKREYDELKREYDELKREFYSTRSYFDNAHDNMTEVWAYGRVHGEDRHGHATPKPIEAMARVMRSSLPNGGLCVEPFGGSGSTLIGAEQTGRVCYTMELTPAYVDVIIARWEKLTGQTAELIEG